MPVRICTIVKEGSGEEVRKVTALETMEEVYIWWLDAKSIMKVIINKVEVYSFGMSSVEKRYKELL